MALDPSYVGHTYPPSSPYLVGREKIREFADAIGADDAAYRDPAAAAALGYPDVIAPPTFPFMVTTLAGEQVIDYPALGVDYSRVVHGDQRFAYVRPVRAGDSLVCVCVIEESMTRAGHGFLTTRTEVATEAGEPVVTVWSRLVVRGEH
jgi:acyl dehydratase